MVPVGLYEGLYVALYKEVGFFRTEVMVVSGPLIRLMVLGSQQWKKMVNVSTDVFNFISNLNHSRPGGPRMLKT